MDNFINSDDYSIFLVGSYLSGSNRVAFAQDQDSAQEGFYVQSTTSSNWTAAIRGNGSAATVVDDGPAFSPLAPVAVRSIVGDTNVGGTATTVQFDTRTPTGAANATGTGATQQLTTVSTGGTRLSLLSGGELSIGNQGGTSLSSPRPFNGDISEIAIFNTKLTDAERKGVNDFLANKWLGTALTGDEGVGQALLEQLAPTVDGAPGHAPELARYQFWRENGDTVGPGSATRYDILIPDRVGSGVTASNFGSVSTDVFTDGTEIPPGPVVTYDVSPGVLISSSGIAPNSLYLVQSDEVKDGNSNWSRTSEQTPSISDANYLKFDVKATNNAQQIDPTELAFTFQRDYGTSTDPGERLWRLQNAQDSYGVWIGPKGGAAETFVKVGGETSLAGPLGTAIQNGFFQTVNVDLTGVAPFAAGSETEIRLYVWHDGPLSPMGDYDQNGVVDAGDYVVWRKTPTGGFLPNDPTPLTGAGPTDYDFWKAHFGEVYTFSAALKPNVRIDNVRLRGNVIGPGSGSGSVAVPEPASIVSLLGGLAALIGCGRGRRRKASF